MSFNTFLRFAIWLFAWVPVWLTAPMALAQSGETTPINQQGKWIETPSDTPVIDRGPIGAWDHLAVDNPFVLVEAGRYYAFYEGQDKPFEAGGHERIGLATSRAGLHWAKCEQNPVLDVGPAGSWDSLVAKLPVVFHHGERNWLFYSGRNATTKQIGLATSTDLVHWQKARNNPVLKSRPLRWDKFLSTHPAAPFVRNGRYYLLYRGMSRLYADQGLGLAVSSDLITWRRATELPVVDARQEIASLAVAPCGDQLIGMAQSPGRPYWTSTNGLHWTKGPAARFSASRVDTLSNPFLRTRRWYVLYEKQDRIYRAVLTKPRARARRPAA